MDSFVLDLSNSNLFYENNLTFDKKVSFLFGKNGTGKSTLASLFQKQSEDYDFRCFQGFDGIVGEDSKLNAVILGEDNNEIDNEIKKIEKEIFDKEKVISDIKKEVFPSEDNTKNLWQEVSEREQSYKKQENKIKDFFRQSASKIKNLNNPQVALTTYNKNHFKNEIINAELLTESEVEKHKKQINTDVKNAKEIDYRLIDFNDLLIKTNRLLLNQVTEKEKIPEFSGETNKTKFAEEGLQLHAINEKCAFCGGLIGKERYEKLERYFSADDVQKFRAEISTHITLLQTKIKEINDIEVRVSDFYPEYAEKVDQINLNFKEKKLEVVTFLSTLKEKSDNKLKELFEKSKELDLRIPESFEEEIIRYNKLVLENNKSNLASRKELSQEKLRFHEIKKCLDKFEYDNKLLILTKLKESYIAKKTILDEEKEKIETLKKEINALNSKIIELQKQTKNERILAEKINQKLSLYVNFNLEYLADSEEKGHYQVKCKNTGEYRDITQLSSGEKNIIAFLYFLQKLNEVDNPKSELDKIIIFDDPMNSNDDTMQYLIIEELNKLIASIGEQDRLLIMTHNNHFYLNVKYKYGNYKKYIYLRLLSDGEKTTIHRLTNIEEDFKTNYEALWKELEFLYSNAPSAGMLLNPIRRIIETYTKFNLIKKSDMLGHVSGAEKLFNVNSHSIDDLEADLNGRNKEDIMKMMKTCFSEENALNHFNQHWNIKLEE